MSALCQLFAGFTLALVAHAAPGQPIAPEWGLKGLRLGATLETVQAAATGLKCETHAHDAGLTYCLDRQSSLGGKPAFLVVKLLGGEAVYIALENLTYEQMTAAVPTLLERFGTPTVSRRRGPPDARLLQGG